MKASQLVVKKIIWSGFVSKHQFSFVFFFSFTTVVSLLWKLVAAQINLEKSLIQGPFNIFFKSFKNFWCKSSKFNWNFLMNVEEIPTLPCHQLKILFMTLSQKSVLPTKLPQRENHGNWHVTPICRQNLNEEVLGNP